MVHPSRYSTSGVVLAKTLVVIHTSESPPTSAQSLLNAFERPGDRLIAGSNPPRYYGASYHAITMGDSTYRQVLGADCGPFAGPPRNKDAWHICMPGYANSTRAEWLTGMRREHIRGVARFLVDKAAGHPFPLVRIGPSELTAGGRGYCGHIDLRVYGQTDHYDPGPQFPWDVLAEDIRAMTQPDPLPITEPEDEPMRIARVPGDLAVYKFSATHAVWMKRQDTVDRELVRAEGGAVQSIPLEDLTGYVLVGPTPYGIDGVITKPEHFASWQP